MTNDEGMRNNEAQTSSGHAGSEALVTSSGSTLPRLAPRARDSHKGDFGRVLLIGGSQGMAGAIALAGMAALRSGAGLVTLAVPSACVHTVASFEPSFMAMPLPSDGSYLVALSGLSYPEVALSPLVIFNRAAVRLNP